MGYDRKQKAKVFHLSFEDPEMEGLEITAGSTSMRGLLELTKFMQKGMTADDVNAGMLDPIVDQFIGALQSWNLEDDGQPVPTTKDALLDQDNDFVLGVIAAWMDAVGGVPAPLEQTSNDGEPSVLSSIPMETMSESRAS